MCSDDENLPFKVECNFSVAVSTVLNQGGRPVAFMSRTLQGSEVNYIIIEKEEKAITESIRKWSHFLAWRHFHLVTYQHSLSFMLDNRKHTPRLRIPKSMRGGWNSAWIKYPPSPSPIRHVEPSRRINGFEMICV